MSYLRRNSAWAKGWSALMPKTTVSESLSVRSEEHTSELQSQFHLLCRLLLEKKKLCGDHRCNRTAGGRRENQIVVVVVRVRSSRPAWSGASHVAQPCADCLQRPIGQDDLGGQLPTDKGAGGRDLLPHRSSGVRCVIQLDEVVQRAYRREYDAVFFSPSRGHQDLHSFPTRRSSD